MDCGCDRPRKSREPRGRGRGRGRGQGPTRAAGRVPDRGVCGSARRGQSGRGGIVVRDAPASASRGPGFHPRHVSGGLHTAGRRVVREATLSSPVDEKLDPAAPPAPRTESSASTATCSTCSPNASRVCASDRQTTAGSPTPPGHSASGSPTPPLRTGRRTAFYGTRPTRTSAPSSSDAFKPSSRPETSPIPRSPDHPPRDGKRQAQRTAGTVGADGHRTDGAPHRSPGPVRRPARGERPALRSGRRNKPRQATPVQRTTVIGTCVRSAIFAAQGADSGR
jgi:hypothetical protein